MAACRSVSRPITVRAPNRLAVEEEHARRLRYFKQTTVRGGPPAAARRRVGAYRRGHRRCRGRRSGGAVAPFRWTAGAQRRPYPAAHERNGARSGHTSARRRLRWGRRTVGASASALPAATVALANAAETRRSSCPPSARTTPATSGSRSAGFLLIARATASDTFPGMLGRASLRPRRGLEQVFADQARRPTRR